jgi:hypothetical protein
MRATTGNHSLWHSEATRGTEWRVNQRSPTCPPHRLSSEIYARYSSMGLPSVATSHRTGSDRTDCTTVWRNSCVDDHGLRRKLTAWNRQLLSSGCETGRDGASVVVGGRALRYHAHMPVD